MMTMNDDDGRRYDDDDTGETTTADLAMVEVVMAGGRRKGGKIGRNAIHDRAILSPPLGQIGRRLGAAHRRRRWRAR